MLMDWNFNPATVFSPAERQLLKTAFQQEKRRQHLMARVCEQALRGQKYTYPRHVPPQPPPEATLTSGEPPPPPPREPETKSEGPEACRG